MTRSRTTTVLTATSLLTLLASGIAGAQVSTGTPVNLTVTATVASGSRMLSVTDVAGGEIQGIALSPGQAKPFRVRVTDTASTNPADVLTGFTVQSSMTQLYQRTSDGGTPSNPADDTYSYDAPIPSSAVTRGFTTSTPSVSTLLASVEPIYRLAASTTADPCSTLSLALAGVCTTIRSTLGDGSAVNTANLTTTGEVIPGVDLSSLTAAQLPLSLADDLASAGYTAPNCNDGLGAETTSAACATPTNAYGTQLKLLDAPLNGLSAELKTLLEAASPDRVAAATDGTGAYTPAALITALNTVNPLLTAPLAGLPAADQATILNALFSVTHTGSLADLVGLTGSYTGFPSLTFTAPNGASGTYGGTLTVVLVDCPPCERR